MSENNSLSKIIVGGLTLILIGVILIISLLTGDATKVKGNLSAQVGAAGYGNSPVLKRGLRSNAEVTKLQQFLLDEGYYTGRVDGSFGLETENSVKAFQTAYEIQPTGVFGGEWKSSRTQNTDEEEGSTTANQDSCAFDLNGDGLISMSDFVMFNSTYGATGISLNTDFNNDGVVGYADLILLMASFGTVPECMVLSVSSTDSILNDGIVINVSSIEVTDSVNLFEFQIQNLGSEDIVINTIPVRFSSLSYDFPATINDPSGMISSAYLSSFVNGSSVLQVLDEKTLSTMDSVNGADYIEFDDLEIVLDANGDIETFLVQVDFEPMIDGNYNPGDFVKAFITALDADNIGADFQDTGDEILPVNIQGQAPTDFSVVYDEGIFVDFLSSSVAEEVENSGVFQLTFSVGAFGGDMYIDKSNPLLNGGTGEADIDFVGLGNGSIFGTSLTSSAEEGAYGFLVEEDSTETFTINVQVGNVQNPLALALTSISFANADIDGNMNLIVGLQEFITPELTF